MTPEELQTVCDLMTKSIPPPFVAVHDGVWWLTTPAVLGPYKDMAQARFNHNGDILAGWGTEQEGLYADTFRYIAAIASAGPALFDRIASLKARVALLEQVATAARVVVDPAAQMTFMFIGGGPNSDMHKPTALALHNLEEALTALDDRWEECT